MSFRKTEGVVSVVLLTSLAVGTGASGQQSPEDQVVAVVDAFHAALAEGDSTTALGHLSDDVIILEGGGA